MSKKSFYEILSVEKNATSEDIKKSYRKLAMEHHPDKGGDEATFKDIAEAYETLSDDEKRKQYDSGGTRQRFQSFDRDSFFRHRSNDVPVGSNIILNIQITLEEIFTGINKKFTYNRTKACEPCAGAGAKSTKVCRECNGHGQVMQSINFGGSVIQLMNVCNYCEGSGNIPEDICESCKGSGVKLVSEEISVDIPSGISEANTINLNAKGNTAKNGTTGLLIIRLIEIPHKVFTRHNNHLQQYLNLTYPQMVLGDSIELLTIDGGKIKIVIPEYSKVGDNLRVKGKGLKALQKEEVGDLNIILSIVTPTSISEEERAVILELKKINSTDNLQPT